MKSRVENLKEYGILGLICLLACGVFLIASQRQAGLGFPLDDAWIHHTFARNFAKSQTWSFQLGIPSGGSTGPLWGIILALVHLVGIDIVLGTHFLGFLLIWASSITGHRIGQVIFPESAPVPLLIGSVLALEWHLVWSALSGMETILLILLSLIVFLWILEKRQDWWIPGVLTGISIWIRPDGITLVGPILLSMVMRRDSAKIKLRNALIFSASLAIVGGPYFIFNYFVAGDVWPNTFYAKQAEYALLRQAGFIPRYLNLGKQIITGIGIILLPGLFLEAWDIYQNQDWERAGILLWVLGYVGLYAARLPVTYQHGRYVIPAVPAFLLLGMVGLVRWIEFQASQRWKRVLSAAWVSAAAVVLATFYGLGARAYALDVGVIETEMVHVARWVNQYTPPSAVIGAHDIGGLGYFGNREIIDLAGLVSPDVIPFIRDQSQLASYLEEKDADYLVTFPSWYPDLIVDLDLIYQSTGEYSGLFGMDNMAVFRLASGDN
jgi:hypothetical protein